VSIEVLRRRAGLLLYAALQFVALTALAMWRYPGGTVLDPTTRGYAFTGNFFSDLGATHAWSGRPNLAGTALFAIALGTIGVAFVAFAPTWRTFAFARGRARGAGIAAQTCGTASGAAFLGVAVTPVNLAMNLHNAFVLAGFGLLLGFAACLLVVWWRNGATAGQRAAGLGYVALVAAYVATTIDVVHAGYAYPTEIRALVIAQKIVAYGSMLYVAFLTQDVRSWARRT
jgi:hypothetical protein